MGSTFLCDGISKTPHHVGAELLVVPVHVEFLSGIVRPCGDVSALSEAWRCVSWPQHRTVIKF